MGWFKKRLAKHPMLDLIKNPKKANAAIAAIDAGQRASNIGYLSEKKMRKLIKQLSHDSGTFGIPARKLEAQGLHAEPILLEALSDPDFLRQVGSSDHFLDRKPAETVIQLLRECGSSKCLPTLRFLWSNKELKDDSIAMFARHCAPEQLNEISPHLTEQDRSLIDSVSTSLQNRFSKQSENNTARQTTINFLTDYLYNDEEKINSSVLEAIAEIDHNTASEILLDPKLLFTIHPNQYFALKQIVESKIHLPENTITKLFSLDLDADSSVFVLHACASTMHSPEWEQRLEQILESLPSITDKFNRGYLVDKIADTIAARLGYESSYQMYNFGCSPDEATPIQIQLCDLDAFRREVSNGGLLQFFFNSSGTYWKPILNAMQTINHQETITILEKAIQTIGLSNSDTTRDAIHKKLGTLTEMQEQKLDTLDKSYYEISDEFECKIIYFVLQNRNELMSLAPKTT